MQLYEEHEYCKKELEQPRLYKIGMFANISRVTIKTLRYYDEQGLLKPAYIDEENGYRYYLATQIADLHQILALREMGLTLEEIKIVNSGESGKDILQRRKQNILSEIAKLTSELAQIESYLTRTDVDLSTPVLIKTLPSVICACRETVIKSYDALFTLMPEMGAEMEQMGCVCSEPDYCFTNYLEPGYKEEDIRIEICEAVTKVGVDSNLVKFKVFPEVKEAACIFHKGSYNYLPKSYEKLLTFIENNGYEIAGEIRESYIDGVWNKETENDWLTEIQIPVVKIK